jgi:hypothetical protein
MREEEEKRKVFEEERKKREEERARREEERAKMDAVSMRIFILIHVQRIDGIVLWCGV